MELKGDIVKINEISQSEIEEMYILMTEFYNDVEKDVFLKDLKEKDYRRIRKRRYRHDYNNYSGR